MREGGWGWFWARRAVYQNTFLSEETWVVWPEEDVGPQGPQGVHKAQIRYVTCKHFLPLPLRLVDGFLCCAEALYLHVIPRVYFCFCCLCFWYHIQKIAANSSVKELPPLCFLLGVLGSQSLMFKSLIHFKFICVSDVNGGPVSLFCLIIWLSQHHLFKRLSFPH